MTHKILVSVLLSLLLSACTTLPDRAGFVSSLFTGAEQYQNFNRLKDVYPTSVMTPAENPYVFPVGDGVELPEKFAYEGVPRSTPDFLRDTDTAALMVIRDGQIRYENYWLTGGRDVNWLSMSVAKSFTSAAIGIAIAEGFIDSIEEPVTKYLPDLAGSAYDGVRIKDILQMSSGARWNEDYSDPNSDVFKLGAVMAVGGNLKDVAMSLEREYEPGTHNRYNSTDTQVLGLLLIAATGRTVASYIEEKLWHPLGMENPGYWLIDDDKVEMTFGGLNATAHDYAKLGELYLNGGNWKGNQIVPGQWVVASVTPDAPHLMPGENPDSDYILGYGYQWWVLDGDQGEYSAIGVYNQFIYVHPPSRTVIVKLSANSKYGLTNDESSYQELETFELFREIVGAIK